MYIDMVRISSSSEMSEGDTSLADSNRCDVTLKRRLGSRSSTAGSSSSELEELSELAELDELAAFWAGASSTLTLVDSAIGTFSTTESSSDEDSFALGASCSASLADASVQCLLQEWLHSASGAWAPSSFAGPILIVNRIVTKDYFITIVTYV